MTRGELLSKIERDIILLWFFLLALLTFHAAIKSAHHERLTTAGSLNAISIARAFSALPEGSELTQAELRDWYEAPFAWIINEGTGISVPDGLNLGPFDLAYVVSVRPFGRSDTCEVLLRTASMVLDTEFAVTVHPNFNCLFAPDYSVFPTRLSYRFGQEGAAFLQYVYFSSVWTDHFQDFLIRFSDGDHCDVSELCIDGEYEPVDFQFEPQPYYSDDRITKEFRLFATQIMPKQAFERINIEPSFDSPNIQTLSPSEYSDVIRQAQSELRHIDRNSDGTFLQQSVRAVWVPFLGILVGTFLVSTLLSRSLRLRGHLASDSEGHVLGPCQIWNVPQILVKLVMTLTPMFGVAAAGLVFQDVFRLSLIPGVFINPMEGMILELTPRIEADRPIVDHNFPWILFPMALIVWKLSAFAASACTYVLIRDTLFVHRNENTDP